MSAEIKSEQAAVSSNAADQPLDNVDAVANLSDNGGTVSKPEFAEEEVTPVIEAIASTGAFWIEWDKLKNLLSFKLKQVLSEYPEGKMTVDQQNAFLGETHQELVQRLDEALLSFDEGPPFTLQRLCEILLSAQGIYPKLSKLALALEKNLLVSSMLTSCVDPPSEMMVQGGDGPEKTLGKPEQQQSPLEQNGGDAVMGDRDETMADVEEADEEGISIGVETFEETARPSATNAAPELATPTPPETPSDS
ncbi:serine/threonine-protein phosphatase 4 regulatory subunit 2-A [Punica granatum]|uniref:Serine/threonine-protein phosphatase 4 regulatory subunit 2-A n=1 Tax=Punica granatum TaxID=22663 RepID=A0A6P8DGC9_PUNGR|nr:serine/threonine-protein phosphatase 4 regulatory subunit 2-A [Punica granatum]